MTHIYNVTGMTCSGCEEKVKTNLLMLPDVIGAEVSKETQTAVITTDKNLSLAALQQALGGFSSQYQISVGQSGKTAGQAGSFFQTYKPVLTLFGYIFLVSFVASLQNGSLNEMLFMRVFMGGFFLSFSFFKLINLKGFAKSYAMYDIIAKRLPAWGYIYALLELGLGVAFLTNFNPLLTNWITLTVMGVSIIGVLESVLNKRKIQCACLGTVFNLPMSTLTIIEDFLMIAMSGIMLLNF